MERKYAIRITDGSTTKLFAVVEKDYVIRHRYLARLYLGIDSACWITVGPWVKYEAFPHSSYFDFPTGNLF